MADRLEDFARRVIGFDQRHRIDAVAVEVMDSFGEAGVGALLLKGPVSARWLYAQGEVRGYTDCDVLADPYRFASASRTMRAAGFHLHSDEATHPEVRDYGRSQVWHRLPEDVWVDLQWRLPGFGLSPGRVWDLLWSEHETMEIGAGRVAVAGEPARALHLTSAADAGSEKALIDLNRAVARLSPEVWDAAARLASEVDARPAMARGLLRASSGGSLAARLGLQSS